MICVHHVPQADAADRLGRLVAEAQSPGPNLALASSAA
jgi:hypothetical protein